MPFLLPNQQHQALEAMSNALYKSTATTATTIKAVKGKSITFQGLAHPKLT